MFINNEEIPVKEKRTIEEEFHLELREHKESLKSIKEDRKKLFVENNEKYQLIEKLTELIQVNRLNLCWRIERRAGTETGLYGT